MSSNKCKKILGNRRNAFFGTPFLKMILNESQLFGFYHLLSNMFRQYVESNHQAFFNNSLKLL
jgi:hypothetical protein